MLFISTMNSILNTSYNALCIDLACDAIWILSFHFLVRLAEMAAKLRVIIEDHIKKLVLPSGIPSTMEELQTFGIYEEFSLQHLDTEFGNYFTLNESKQIQHKDTIKVVKATPIILNFLTADESLEGSFIQQLTDCTSIAESSAGTSSSQDTIILSRQSSTERCQPWPKHLTWLLRRWLWLATKPQIQDGKYRTKLRGCGVPEVACHALKCKSPADQKPAKRVKKPWKAEVNYLPPYPPGEDEESQEQERIQLLTEVRKRDSNKIIKEKMAKTFAHKRNKIFNLSPSIEAAKARWPALFEASYVKYS